MIIGMLRHVVRLVLNHSFFNKIKAEKIGFVTANLSIPNRIKKQPKGFGNNRLKCRIIIPITAYANI